MRYRVDKCGAEDFEQILQIINRAAQAYRGVIPDDCFHDPYMPATVLSREIKDGVNFWSAREPSDILGVMGIQDVENVTLIRHAYVRPSAQRRHVGSSLLRFLLARTDRPILVGTWKAAHWAVAFYQAHGFELIPFNQIEPLLKRYWTVPDNQIENSIVLAKPEQLELL